MGLLAENKTRRKINKDPNNTKWTKDTNTFGQKILRAQGWQPGQFLGAQDAPHSELHTAANASYIRVVLKDDMKGLGFSKSKEDEITGLDVFQDLLSRLNGKTDDAIEEDQQARLAVKTHHFVEQRYGAMKFVYGGLLVGDEMKGVEDKAEKQQTETSSDEDVVMESAPTPKESKKEKKSKKRKANDEEEEESSSRETDSKSKKRRKEERKLKEADSDDAKAKKKKEKKEKKDKSRKKSTEEVSDDEDATLSEERSKKRKSKSKDKSRSPEESDEDKVKSKKEKKEKKDKKKRKKEETSSESTSTPVTQDSTPAASAPGTGVTTPSGTSTPRGSRNFVRSRFIAQKRQAVLDTKALNQIFMVKA